MKRDDLAGSGITRARHLVSQSTHSAPAPDVTPPPPPHPPFHHHPPPPFHHPPPPPPPYLCLDPFSPTKT